MTCAMVRLRPRARLRSCSCTPTALSLPTRPPFALRVARILHLDIALPKASALQGPFAILFRPLDQKLAASLPECRMSKS